MTSDKEACYDLFASIGRAVRFSITFDASGSTNFRKLFFAAGPRHPGTSDDPWLCCLLRDDMGYMRHHSILVTSCIDNLIEQAHAKAVEICGDCVSPLNAEQINGYRSFAVFPDGSKEGWPDSELGDARRTTFKAWLNTQRYEDGSTSLDWVEVQYGDDDKETCIIADSDHPEEAVVVDAIVMLPDSQ